ncbi:MAG: hypothetical protein JO185_09430 [Acidobacteriaceae bacterium]|nr:hypothetical protein [Acidobacteriaceae bacterium]
MPKNQHRIRTAVFFGAACFSVLTTLCLNAIAEPVTLALSGSLTSSSIGGVTVGAGAYTIQQLAEVGAAIGTVTADGRTGVPLWGLLGGNSTGTASDVVTDSGKNAILRSYLLATNSSGFQAVISMGELDPFFGGKGSDSPFIAFSGTNGSPALVFPQMNAAGRNIENLTSLQVLSVPALPVGPGGLSTSLMLSGNVSSPGTYTLADLKKFPPVTETASGDIYTGVSLWTLLSANDSNVFTQYVLAAGTDGYEVLFSLAELDPSLAAQNNLLPYADTAGQFPADGFVRIVIPGDNHAGRYVSNLNQLEVTSIPEPGTLLLLGWSLLALCSLRCSYKLPDAKLKEE